MIFDYYKGSMIAILAVSILLGDFQLVGASDLEDGKVFWRKTY
jgi:hypothetical protein